MKEQEKKFFLALCRFAGKDLEPSLTAYATPGVLGQLFYNRLAGVAHETLRRQRLLDGLPREFRNALENAAEQNAVRNRSYYRCVKELAGLLERGNSGAVMLKGALLCALYPEGCRTSNDIDLLAAPEEVTALGGLLTENGFRQGTLRGGAFVPASREEIIASKMLRGETVPYFREVALPGLRWLEVDVNFSLGYTYGEPDVLRRLLASKTTAEVNGLQLPVPARADFFVHLCAHLYKEAATLPWVRMKRDMTLYKYADLYLLLSGMSAAEKEDCYVRSRELGLAGCCGFAVLQTAALFGLTDAELLSAATDALDGNVEMLHRVAAPSEKKIYRYRTEDVAARFFLDDRLADLEEVPA